MRTPARADVEQRLGDDQTDARKPGDGKAPEPAAAKAFGATIRNGPRLLPGRSYEPAWQRAHPSVRGYFKEHPGDGATMPNSNVAQSSCERQLAHGASPTLGQAWPIWSQFLNRFLPRFFLMFQIPGWNGTPGLRPGRIPRHSANVALQWRTDRLKIGAWTHGANRLHHVKK